MLPVGQVAVTLATSFRQRVKLARPVGAVGVAKIVVVKLVIGPAQLDELTQASVNEAVVPDTAGVTVTVNELPTTAIPGEVLASELPTGQLMATAAVHDGD